MKIEWQDTPRKVQHFGGAERTKGTEYDLEDLLSPGDVDHVA
jgi:hypothetical protein